MSGTVNIPRSIWHDPAFKDQPLTEREAYMWLVMEASWKARTKRVGDAVVDLERGQLAVSIRFLAEAWQWKKSTVDRFLKRLKNRDSIGTASGTGVTVITIRDYSEIQNAPSNSGTGKNKKRDSSGTAAGQTRISEGISEERERGANDEKQEPSGPGSGSLACESEKPSGQPSSLQADQARPCEAQRALEAWNAMAGQAGLAKAEKLTDPRKQKLKQRIKDAGGIDAFTGIIRTIPQSKFLTGDNQRGFKASIDFVCRAERFISLMEGVYHDGKAPAPPPSRTPEQIQAIRERAERAKAYEETMT